MPKISFAAFALLALGAPAALSKTPPARSEAPAKKHGAAAGHHAAAQAAPAAPAPAKPKAPAASSAKEEAPKPVLDLKIEKAQLDNGLRVVMNVDHTSPTIAVAVTYDVGARNEERGRSGFAHLFEHMMFEGSANVPKGEHFKLVSAHGGNLNGTTSSDRTNYFEMLPASELPLA